MVAGGHAWFPGGVRGCQGVCMVAGGMCGCRGACMVAGGGVRGIRRDTVNERAVRILVECILVLQDAKIPLSALQIEELIKALDQDGDGEIDFR